MKLRHLALLFASTLPALPALAYTGECTSSEGSVLLTITTNDRGQITDMTLKKPGTSLSHYPEANGRMVVLSSYSMAFSAKETAMHDALDLHVAGREGRMSLGGQTFTLECDWIQN